jgi:transposase
MVLSRLVEPRSKKKVWELVSESIDIPGVEGQDLPLSSYYRTLEYLSDEKERIEKAIHSRLVNLFNQDVSLVFYDLTSACFEGKGPSMAKHGYSREHRPDLLQIEIGLLVDAEGLPIGHEVFDGNLKDVTTVLGTLKRLHDQFGVRRCVFIGDDGMASEANLSEVARCGYEYITSLSLGKSEIGRKLLKSAPRPREWKRIEDNLWLKALACDECPDVRYIGTYNPDRAASTRQHRKARLRSCIEHLRKLLATPKPRGRKKTADKLFVTADRFLVRKGCEEMILLERTESGFSWTLSRDALRKAYRLDGMLVLKTNSKTLSDVEVANGYRTLWRVEDAFRHIKDGIGLRPIRHWNDARVLGHVFVCVLAYTLERLYERELAKAGLDVTARAALDELRTIIVATLQADDRRVRRRSEITASQRQLLAAAGITEVPELW